MIINNKNEETMIKNVMKVVFVAAIAMVAGICVFNTQESEVLSDVAMANVEALANGEGGGLDCNYLRDEGTCTIYVGIGGSLRLLKTLEVLSADSQGNITIEGKVVCSSGGSSTCKPFECYELYQIF